MPDRWMVGTRVTPSFYTVRHRFLKNVETRMLLSWVVGAHGFCRVNQTMVTQAVALI